MLELHLLLSLENTIDLNIIFIYRKDDEFNHLFYPAFDDSRIASFSEHFQKAESDAFGCLRQEARGRWTHAIGGTLVRLTLTASRSFTAPTYHSDLTSGDSAPQHLPL